MNTFDVKELPRVRAWWTGFCHLCGKTFEPGEIIVKGRNNFWFHRECVTRAITRN